MFVMDEIIFVLHSYFTCSVSDHSFWYGSTTGRYQSPCYSWSFSPVKSWENCYWLTSGDDDPDLSEKELKEIGLLLLRHAMATSQQSLAASILSRFPSLCFIILLARQSVINAHCSLWFWFSMFARGVFLSVLAHNVNGKMTTGQVSGHPDYWRFPVSKQRQFDPAILCWHGKCLLFLLPHQIVLIPYSKKRTCLLQVLSPQGRPLPDILNHSFLYTLHDGLKSFLVSHPVAIEKMPREDLVKMMAGLRTLILKAALLSSQFTSRDVQSLMTAFLPTLPITPLNTAQWLDWTNPLHISLNLEKQQFIGNLVEIQTPEQHQAILSNISRNNEAMKKYFTAQLKMLAKHRLDCEVNDKNTDWVKF